MNPVVFYSTFRGAINNSCDDREKIMLDLNGNKTRHYQLCIGVMDKLTEEYDIHDIPFAYGPHRFGYFSYGLDKLCSDIMNNFNLSEQGIDSELLPKMEKIIGDIKHNYLLPEGEFNEYIRNLPKKQDMFEFCNQYAGVNAGFALFSRFLESSNGDIGISLLKKSLSNFGSCLNLEYNKEKREEICRDYLNLSLLYCDNYQDFPKNTHIELHALFRHIYGISLPYMEHLVYSDTASYNTEAMLYSKKQKTIIEEYYSKYRQYKNAYYVRQKIKN